MRKFLVIMMLIMITTALFACAGEKSPASSVSNDKQALENASAESPDFELERVNDHVWVHTTYADYQGHRTPSNGLILETSDSLVLIDTPWNNAQTSALIKYASNKFGKAFSLAIITHAHEDRMGGIGALIENSIGVQSTSMTAQLAEEQGLLTPEPNLDNDPRIEVGDTAIEVFYPGEGHSRDNIVVWIPEYKVLFGGCIIKPLDAKGLGNTADANVGQWPASVRKIKDRFKEADLVIPGHGRWGNAALINHTLELTEK